MWIGSKMDRGYDVRAIIERVKGSHLAGAALGVVLRINMEGDDPDLEEDWDGGETAMRLTSVNSF